MNGPELLETLRGRGITVSLAGTALNVEPKDRVTADDAQTIAALKSQIIPLLQGTNGSVDTTVAPLVALGPSPSAADLETGLRAVAGRLDGADGLHRAAVREALVQRLQGLGVGSPAKLADATVYTSNREGADDARGGRQIILADPEPWPDPVDGAELLEDLASTFRRFVMLPAGAADTLALWAVHTFALDATEIAPVLALVSPVKRCGKTTTLLIAGRLVRRPLPAANITAAAVFRAIEAFSPTLMLDEVDTFLPDASELRGVLNSGHTKGSAYVVRNVGDDHEPRTFSTWCAKMTALIGKLPDTLEDRSICVPMRRRAPNESKVERLRLAGPRGRQQQEELEVLRRRTTRWVNDHLTALSALDPDVPDELNDRAQDNWRPLLAIADCAGRDWPTRARTAAKLLAGVAVDDDVSVQLLSDLRDIFDKRAADTISTSELIEALTGLDERPWSHWAKGKAMTAYHLAKLLRPFGVRPRDRRSGDQVLKGYRRDELGDVFARYLPSEPLQPLQVNESSGLGPVFDPLHGPAVADRKSNITARKESDVAGVADSEPESRPGHRVYEI